MAMRNNGSSSIGRPVAVEDHRQFAPPRRRANRLDERRIAVVGQYRVRACDDLVGIGRRRRGDSFIAIRDDGAVAARIHEDRRQRRRQTVDALTERAIDLFARECSQHAVAVGVVACGSAHRAGERSATAEAGDRHRRIGRAAAVDHEKSRRLHLAVGLRELLDAKHFVEHDDAGAEDARRGDRGHVNQSIKDMAIKDLAAVLDEAANEVMGDGDRRRRGQAVGMAAAEHLRQFVASKTSARPRSRCGR